ncbi:uncharacterized protein LOC129605286 isoform X1 [Condylostylus longicornis]|uniref:uncharacterized protein LOC129605286 isoform X1 n=1 Tax=Condylostylus longicornis TaxID=2530218 RepID=UPI00244DFCB0|nr:uncharacterized protein LOC129605286 isoform X1 [Condylostylus longicornis]XP_055370919.1 uncharacterized protein LOC129605286 isoform X1 [Condylostylus longicornis]XP_055370920.1 uncharacterized protein LOC129605286 isoform X1 [Condylostylus longicornis]
MTDVNTLMSSPFVRVKLVAFIHFIFIGNAMLGTWIPGAYIFYNILFIMSMMWSLHCKDSSEAIHTALIINVTSIFFDLICIIAFFSHMNGWVIAFSIINLIIRPFTSILLHRELNERGGVISAPVTIFPAKQQRSYEDIDRPHQPVPTNNSQPPPNVSRPQNPNPSV